jgi:hypothetical protein
MLFVCRPYHLSDDEADRWMRSQAAPLVDAAAVDSVRLSRLQAPAAWGGGDWDWLIEFYCRGAEEARRTAREEVLRDMVADLRLLGMNPRLVLADGTRLLEG